MDETPANNAMDLYQKAFDLNTLLAQYLSYSSLSILIVCLQILLKMDFHPRMGLVTRTLNTAKFDLAFFMLLFGLVHTLYAFLGCMLFGNMAAAYADLGTGWLTGMKMLLGNYDPEGDVGQSVWTICFYWSYMVVAFFLLLNALLAIIVEAYDTVKQDTDEDKIDVLFIFGYENSFVKKYRAGAFQMPLAHLLSILEAAADPVGSLKTAPAAAQSSLAAMVKKLHESTDPVIVYNDTHFFPIPGGSLEHKTTEAFDQGMIEAVLAATLGINEQEANVLGWNMISMFGKNVDANGDGVIDPDELEAFVEAYDNIEKYPGPGMHPGRSRLLALLS